MFLVIVKHKDEWRTYTIGIYKKIIIKNRELVNTFNQCANCPHVFRSNPWKTHHRLKENINEE